MEPAERERIRKRLSYARKMEKTGRVVNPALGRRRVDEQVRVDSVARVVCEHVAAAGRVLAITAQVIRDHGERSAAAALAAEMSAAASAAALATQAAGAQAEMAAEVEVEVEVAVEPPPAQPAAAVSEAPPAPPELLPVVLPQALMGWTLPQDLTFEIMESWLSKDAAWLSLSLASKALNISDQRD